MALRRAHLRLAVRAGDRAPVPLAAAIAEAFGAFCAGATAPDGHGNRAVPRESTHFYVFHDPHTWGLATRRLCAAHPALSRPDPDRPAQTAYVAGYLAHLAVDEVFACVLGQHAVERDGPAIRGLAYALEDDWGRSIPELERADAALLDFIPAGLETIVDSTHLIEFITRTNPAASARTPAELLLVLARAAGRARSAAEAASQAERSVTLGRELFGADIARRFAALAGEEIARRLRAYALGEAARYDAPSLRPDA